MENLAQLQSAQQRFLASFGEDNQSWAPLFQDNKLILEQLKSPDEMVVFEAVSNLQNQLSMAQDNTLSNFPVDHYIPALLEILKRYPESDISNEINMFATQCLTNLMDIYPNICNTIVTHGGVKCFALVLERSMGFIDLNEACIKALERISVENPHAILTSGAIGLILNMIDFFEISTQKRIIAILLNVSRHSASETDLNEYLLPVLPCLCMFLHSRGGGDENSIKIENISLIILKIFESLFRFINPATQPEKLALQIGQIGSTGIIDAILSSLQDYQEFEVTMRASQTSSPQKGDNSKIKMLSNLAISNFLKTLTLCCSYSVDISRVVLNFQLLKILDGFLPSQEDQKLFSVETFPFILETLSLIDSLLPSKEEELALAAEGQPLEPKAQQQKIAQEKRNLYGGDMQVHLQFIAERLLPKIFNVHENNVQGTIRSKTLQVIDKLILLFSQDLLTNFVEPYSFAKFIYSNMRTKQLPAILQCLQMVQKLMRCNPECYTLALIREGVSPSIKQLGTMEELEKMAGINFKEDEPPTDLREELLRQAKTALLRGPEGTDEGRDTDRMFFEQTIQKYMELAKSGMPGGPPPGSRLQQQIGKQILSLAESLLKEFFDNQVFLDSIFAKSGEELKTLQALKKIADDLVEEAKHGKFDFEKNRELLDSIADLLTKDKPLLSYEIKESGLLDSLNAYLTMTPKQVESWDQQRKLDSREEQKKSELVSQVSKEAAQLSKKQAKSYIWRLKVFLHTVIARRNGKQPISELVSICHDIISQNDFLIFDSSPTQDLLYSPFGSNLGHQLISDPNQSLSALKQLTRRMRVTLVYDPTKSSTYQKKAEKALSLDQQPIMQKSFSHQPAFQHLADSIGAEELQSKVYMKRNFLYNELKQVLVSVEQCASLFLLEDFLRNRIRNMEDVKQLKLPSSYFTSRGGKAASKEARIIIDKALNMMRQLLDSSTSREGFALRVEEFQERLVDEIIRCKDLTEIDQLDVIRQLETHSLQLIDDFYADHEEGRLGDGSMEDDFDIDERLNEFQSMVQRLRDIFKKKKIEQIRGKKSSPKKEEDADMVDSSSSNVQEEEEKIEQKREDVDMTDEEGEELRKQAKAAERRFQRSESDASAILIGASSEQAIKDDGDPFIEDLDQLIKANGEDIEYEFYVGGERMVPNQTIYEVLKIVENKAKRQRDIGPGGLAQFMSQIQSGDQVTVYFAIKDKHDNLQKQRKDSIIEFSQRRERSKSEAVHEISGSSVNHFVQTLLDKEFQIFENGELGLPEKNSAEKRQLQSALKVLKVLNFLCRNTNLFSTQGIKFLVSGDEELKQEGFQDLDLQVGLSSLHVNLFHHPKLDAYILRNIQDPYNLISGQVSETLSTIFKTCPFLFPFQTRLLFFKLISFIGSIDMNRSIYFLRQFLKQKMGKLPQEDKSAVKSQRQKVIVDRNKILECSLNLLNKVSNRAFLEVEYKDEVGTGLGPTLEFYYLVASEIKNFVIPQTSQKLWRQGMSDNSLYPSPLSLVKTGSEEMQKVYDVFRLAGMMVAKSISDDKLIDLPLSPLFWDLVLGKKMTIFDLERLDPNLYKVFADLQILANKKRDIEKAIHLDEEHKLRQLSSLKTASGARIEDLSLVFTLPGYDEIEMKLDGKNEDVKLENLQEYIDLTMHYFFHETVKVQFQAFKKGFNQIFTVESLRPFSQNSMELEDIICGTQRNEEEWNSALKLSEFIVPAHGFHQKSAQYQYLLRFITELGKEERRKFLKFVTGSPRLPSGGFGALDPKLTVVLKKPIAPAGLSQEILSSLNDEILPSVMTCQNYVKLPAYSSYEILKYKFEQAYNEGCNSFTLS